jgi:rhodanese-related sulfurtransferase
MVRPDVPWSAGETKVCGEVDVGRAVEDRANDAGGGDLRSAERAPALQVGRPDKGGVTDAGVHTRDEFRPEPASASDQLSEVPREGDRFASILPFVGSPVEVLVEKMGAQVEETQADDRLARGVARSKDEMSAEEAVKLIHLQPESLRACGERVSEEISAGTELHLSVRGKKQAGEVSVLPISSFIRDEPICLRNPTLGSCWLATSGEKMIGPGRKLNGDEGDAFGSPSCANACTNRMMVSQYTQEEKDKQRMADARMPAISVEELKQRLDRKENVLILDVREPSEVRFANIGGLFIPLRELPGRLGEIDKDREIAVLCHHGNRSARAVQFLLQSGFPRVKNVAGGIDAWSERVDANVRRY